MFISHPTLNLIGSGNIATQLGLALSEIGYPIKAVYSRSVEHAAELARQLHDAIALNDITQLPTADIYLFAVKDDILPSLIKKIAAYAPTDSLFIHTAGCVGIDVFSSIPQHSAVIYPMQTISKQRALDFSHVPLFIEGDNQETETTVRTIASCLSRLVSTLSSEGRRKLHLAAVFACNFTNHCYTLAAELMEEAGLSPDILLPLIDETAEKVHRLPARDGQTGPAVRNDKTVMERHLEILNNHPRLAEIYRLMSLSIYETSRKPTKK